MIGSIGLNSIVSSNNLSVKKLACQHAISFKSLPDTFQTIPNSVFGGLSQETIESIISATQRLEPIDDGFTSKVFKINDKVIKMPLPRVIPNDLRDHITHQNVKEYIALKKIESIDPAIATKAHDVIKHNGLYSLVEDFVQGVHPHKNNITDSHISNLINNFAKLDINGIVSADLQPKNIFLQKDGTTKLIDFGSYMFLAENGFPLTSDGYPGMFFLDKNSVAKTLSTPSRNKVANTFFVDRFYDYKNKIANPYLNMHSNVSNFEFRTLYEYLLNGTDPKPLDFFRNYVKKKGEVYHPQLRDFLKTINLEQDVTREITKEQLISAKEMLSKAIDFEDVASQVLSNPTDDVLKAELAQIQLRALLAPEQISSSLKNDNQLRAAYNQLDDMLNAGLNNSTGVKKRYFQHCIEGLKKQSAEQTFDAMQINIPNNENFVNRLFGTTTPINTGLNTIKKSNKKLWALATAGIAIAGAVVGYVAFKKRNNNTSPKESVPEINKTSVSDVKTNTSNSSLNSTISTTKLNNTNVLNSPFAKNNTPSVFSQFV